MTALCGGGPSGLQPGKPEDIVLTTSAVAALLNNIPTAWAVPLAGALGLLSYHLTTFCTTDPPGYPTFSAGDWLLIYTADPSPAGHTARQKLVDTIDTYLWYQMCQCTSTTTPSVPTGPSAPTDAPVVNPPTVGPAFPTGSPCGSYVSAGNSADTTVAQDSVRFPIGTATLITTHLDPPLTFTGSQCFEIDLLYRNASGTVIGGGGTGGSTTGYFASRSLAVPSGTATYEFHMNHTACAYTPSFAYDFSASVYCGSSPGDTGGPVPQPCLPDPMVQIMLERILELVTLIQRQNAPFAYISGTAHTGLTGTGTLSVSGILGLLVNASVPSSTSELAGTPDIRLPIGRVNFGTSDGYRDRDQLVTDSQVIFPSTAGIYTIVGYSLEPGVTATLTELVREP